LTWVLCYVIAILFEWFFAGVFKENKERFSLARQG